MSDWVRKALTRKRVKRGPRGIAIIEEPNERLVYAVKFSIGMTACLTVMEVAHLFALHSWNSEIFAAIMGLVGTVTGILISQQG
jgi:hypothetical protein